MRQPTTSPEMTASIPTKLPYVRGNQSDVLHPTVDLLHVLFGTVLALNDAAIFLIAGIATVTLVGLAVIYRPLVMECFDPGFLRSVSPLSPVAHYDFLVLAVLNLVGGFHALGTLMAVGIMILPAAAARFWTRDITSLLVIGVLGAFVSGFVGLLLSYHASLPSGPAIILTTGVFYLFSLTFGPDGVVMMQLLLNQVVSLSELIAMAGI